jgi:O-antigen/teichoic acid export membrane protein
MTTGTGSSLNKMEGYIDEIVRGSVYILLGLLLVKAASFLTQMLIARSLGPETYGLIVLAIMAITVSTRLLLLGIPDGLTRYIPRFKGKEEKIDVIRSGLTISLPVAVIFSVLVYLNSNFIAVNVFNEPGLTPLIEIVSFAIPFSVLIELLVASLRGYRRAKEKLLIETLQTGSLLIILLALSLRGLLNLTATTFFFAFSYLIGAIFGLFLLYRTINEPIKKVTGVRSSLKRELLSYSAPLIFSGALAIVMTNLDKFMISYFLGSGEVGLYNSGYKLSEVILLPLAFMGYIYFPLSSHLLKEGKKEQLKKLLPLINKWGAASVFPVMFLFIAYPLQVIFLFFGSEYAGAAPVLQILTLGFTLHLLNGKTGETLKSGGHTGIILAIMFVDVAINVVFNFLLIPIYGVTGAALATAITFLIGSSLAILALMRYMCISPFSRNYLIQCVLGVVTGGVLIALNNLFGLTSMGNVIFVLVDVLLFYSLMLLLSFLINNIEKEDYLLVKIPLKLAGGLLK